MNRALIAAIVMLAGCSTPNPGPEPSLALRAAEAIDPRVPITDETPAGLLDLALAARLQELLGSVQSNLPTFNEREAQASRLASAAGPMASESWIAAEQALSRLVAAYGPTTHAAAEIDALAADRLERQRWIAPADRNAITAAAAKVGEISERQAAAIERLKNQLAR